MTVKEYIQNLSKKISKQYSEQLKLKSRLSSKYDKIASGKEGSKSDLEELKYEINVLERMNPDLLKTQRFVHSVSERVENEMKCTSSQNIKGVRGTIISEKNYEVGDDMKYVSRSTKIDGINYQYIQMMFGDTKTRFSSNKPYAKVTEAYENGEQTYYEMQANGGPYERTEKKLAYENRTYASENGIPIIKKVRNPAKDMTKKEVRDYKNGTTITLDRPVIDSKGNIIGNYNYTEQCYHYKNDYAEQNKKIL